MVLRLCLKEASELDLTTKLGQLLQADTHLLKKTLSNILVPQSDFQMLNSSTTEAGLSLGLETDFSRHLI